MIDSQDDVLILIIKCKSSTYFTEIRFDGGETYSCGSKVSEIKYFPLYIVYKNMISFFINFKQTVTIIKF